MSNSIVYINSTLQPWSDLYRDGDICPLHYWGYSDFQQNNLLCIKNSRIAIQLRYRLGGLDIPVLWRTYQRLKKGAKAIYLVTPPDILAALPFLRYRFPSKPIVTWVWTADDVRKHHRKLKHATHIFCLTEDAKEALDYHGMEKKSSFHLWGAAPEAFVDQSEPKLEYDLNFLGLSRRDLTMINNLLESKSYSVVTTPKAASALETTGQVQPNLSMHELHGFSALKRILKKSRVTVIPIFSDDNQPSGYTNLVESLLCGTPVVIPKESLIPRRALYAKGVFHYEAGNYQSMKQTLTEAVKTGSDPDARQLIQESASTLFNGKSIKDSLRNLLQ
ncbi:hypothetical protein [Rubellicoccus peritrichatus]|uniref:Uncharacterized protein n=1 Tax=Rubellicoccus peritrichatus TaxID=3080537 RepID=A0AAQ3LF60_9BACT|nr:hypothetical protein [Puniceicoccus sp. CR14]WOO40819.1 hypothetical protein RZN69_19520 [Puniceicoccus sp. CR14]